MIVELGKVTEETQATHFVGGLDQVHYKYPFD